MAPGSRGRLFLLHWDAIEATQAAASLEQDGWVVAVEFQDGARAAQAILAEPPDAVVVYLTRRPAHGREVIKAVRTAKAGRTVPIVVVGGEQDALAKTQSRIRDVEYVGEPSLKRTLARFATPTPP